MVFPWCLSDSKSPQVSSTLLTILDELNNAVVWMVSTCPLISKSSNHFTNLFVTVPSKPVITGITVTFTFHNFFSSLARSWNLSLFSLSFSFILWSVGIKSIIRQVLVFCRLSLGLVVWPRLGGPFISENPREVCASHFPGLILGCSYTICSHGQI